jgi:hypothetical protein
MRPLAYVAISTVLLGTFSIAHASDIITFDAYKQPDACNSSISTQGLTFSSVGICGAVWDGTSPNGNGTAGLILGPSGSMEITLTDGGAFNLTSFEMTTSWYSLVPSTTVNVTAMFSGGGSLTSTLTLGTALQTYLLNLSDVTALNITSLATNTGYWLVDNIIFVDVAAPPPPVPEPSSVFLVGAGILAVALRLRRDSGS